MSPIYIYCDKMYWSKVCVQEFRYFVHALDIQGGGSPQLYYHDCSGRIPGHTTRAPPVGFELETNSFQLYAIANLDKTSLQPEQSGTTILQAKKLLQVAKHYE